MQLHTAAVVAGSEQALQVELVCGAAGIRILKASPSNGAYQPRDTVAVKGIGDLIRGRGPAVAATVMKVIADAGLAPVTSAAIRAADYLLHNVEHAGAFDPSELTKAIVALGDQADRDAGVFAAEHCVPRWRGLAAVWFKKTKKRKWRGEACESESEIITPFGTQPTDNTDSSTTDSILPSSPSKIGAASQLGGVIPAARQKRVVIRHPDRTVKHDFGDPPPGRSAEDQRLARAAREDKSIHG